MLQVYRKVHSQSQRVLVRVNVLMLSICLKVLITAIEGRETSLCSHNS